LYPLIGLGLGLYYARKYLKYRDESLGELVTMTLVMMLLWPYGWYASAQDIRDGKKVIADREEHEYEALLESIRRERYAPDPRLAEFDKELYGEPAPELVEHLGKMVPAKTWREDYDEMMGADALDYIDDARLCDPYPRVGRGTYDEWCAEYGLTPLPKYSRGGRV
jgi:hypothetical protein